MGRGVSAGGGQSSLGYLFGSGEAPAPKPATNNAPSPPAETLPTPAPVAAQPVNVTRQIPAGTSNSSTNNYIRADGQNTGNFLTVMSLSLLVKFGFLIQCCVLVPGHVIYQSKTHRSLSFLLRICI